MNYKNDKLTEYLIIQNIKVLKNFKEETSEDVLRSLNFFLCRVDSVVFFDYESTISYYNNLLFDYLNNLRGDFFLDESLFLDLVFRASFNLKNKLSKSFRSSILFRDYSHFDFSQHSEDFHLVVDFLRVHYSFYLSENFLNDFLNHWKEHPSLLFKDVLRDFSSSYEG